MTTGDIIGWAGVITLFVLFWAVIYFVWRRAQPPKTGSENWLAYIFDKIEKLDAEIRRLLKLVEELNRQREELKKQAKEHVKLRQELEEKHVIEPKPEIPILVAVIGSDDALDADLTALRSVRNQTGMQFVRIQDATLAKLKTVLDRERANGHTCNLHLAVHSGSQGIELGGAIIDGVALSEILDGVQVMVIAGCRSDQVADLLGVVPFVVSFTEEISHADAKTFSRIFWTGIGNGIKPEQALREALKKSPASLSEFVTRH